MDTTAFVEEIDYRELEFGEIVGKGAFGVVSKARWRGKDVAVKRIETEQEKKGFMQELKQLSRVSHPNIVKLYGACREQPVCLVMEYAEGGSLYNVLHGSGPQPHYTAAHAMSWALQCARGVEYLHGMKPKALIHRDLKPPNLLLIQFGTVLKICDFGTACDIHTYMTNNKGSAAWMAPEVFEGSNYSEKCDVFSWGIILWEVFTRRKPFDEIGGPAFRIMWAVHRGKRPPLIQGLPKPLEVLMTKCWSGNPAERPSMSEVVRIMSHLFQFFHGADQPLTIPRNSNSMEDDNDVSIPQSPLSYQATPTNNVHLASPPLGESRAGTISDTIRYNHEGEVHHRYHAGTYFIISGFLDTDTWPWPAAIQMSYTTTLAQNLATFFEFPHIYSTGQYVYERPRGQMSAPPSLAASRESLNEARSRSGTPVDSSKRYSADFSQLDEHDQSAIPPQKVLGHRRSGSQGTTPIYVTAGSMPPPPPTAFGRGLGRHASYEHLVPSTKAPPPSIVITPSVHSHRRIGSDEYARIAAMNSSSQAVNVNNQDRNSGVHHCPTYPGELNHFSPATSPPLRSVSYQPQSTEPINLMQRIGSTSLEHIYHPSNTPVKEGQSTAYANILGGHSESYSYFLLEPHLQPLAPYPTNPESMNIFDQHVQLAQEYLRVQAEIAVLTQRKHELTHEMEQEESQHNSSRIANIEEYTRLSSENESLMSVHRDLKTQVESYRKATNKRYGAAVMN
ncbi:mitogen-activated protein kinase kinase kinase 7-like [Pomacea canaliculata]|uniref:mitogen-activated protein kinase kinase kinase 7-like n=1 Tax=Pomacea canaliculata TaxID=400727 RepID=UPI000D725E48|nr:mitogen-activated protein kinase kinase kinase 7-like [Pomacea canaliculata]